MKARMYKAGIATTAVALGASIFGLTAGASAADANDAVVTKLSVAKGSTLGGTVVTITGKKFTGTTDVEFGATAATSFLIVSDTQIVAKAPVGSGTVQVKVTNATTNESANTAADDFAYIQPINAVVAAGTLLNPLGKSVLTITPAGTGLTAMGADKDAFKGLKVTATVNGAVAQVAWGSATTVKVTVPAGTPSATGASVVLLRDGVAGAADTNAKYAAVITKLSKTSGGVAADAAGTITVTGKGLTTATGLTFGATAVTGSCTHGTGTKLDTEYTCTGIPAGTGSVAVKATFPASTITYGTLPTAAYTFSDVS
ncbi:IPT/TIG domain-containing protein [Actinoplanes sp. NPDC049668]|uniref:IPT/TIG domain-containing protein n=1 Tax=unclassified Actinoplanes TaxID=2626549 RepID=UPI0033BDB082